MLSDQPLIVVVNESSVLTADQAWKMAWATGYQLRWQYGPLWRQHADVQYLPKGVAVPPGAWILHLLDTSDQQSALGYHDEEGNEVPYGRVFVKTAQEYGQQPSEVLSHEALELVRDPWCNCTAWDEAGNVLYALEVCDPVQGGSYDLGAPYNRPTGIVMSDFVLPSYFDNNTPVHVPTSYRGTTTGPFTVGHEGYVGYTTKLPPEWQQKMGDKADKRLFAMEHRNQRREKLA
jgi:hypothetical protein